MGYYGRWIGGNEVFILPQSQEQGAAEPGGNYLSGILAGNYGYSVSTPNKSQSLSRCFFKIAVEKFFNKVADYLCVRVGTEIMPFFQ